MPKTNNQNLPINKSDDGLNHNNTEYSLDNNFKAVYNASIRFLAFREHSQQELSNKLLQKGFDTDLIRKVLMQLADENLQSDTRFAEFFVRSWAEKGRGPVRIRHDLATHNLSDEYFENAVIINKVDWFEIALVVWHKKFGNVATSLKEKAKQYRFMQQRGFDFEQINSVLNQTIY